MDLLGKLGPVFLELSPYRLRLLLLALQLQTVATSPPHFFEMIQI